MIRPVESRLNDLNLRVSPPEEMYLDPDLVKEGAVESEDLDVVHVVVAQIVVSDNHQ